MKAIKKGILLLAITMTVAQMPTTVMAHGHGHGSHHATTVTYSQCSETGCKKTGKHKHNGVCYYGHSSNGKTYSQCNVPGCTKTRKHKHNGKCYYGHSTTKTR